MAKATTHLKKLIVSNKLSDKLKLHKKRDRKYKKENSWAEIKYHFCTNENKQDTSRE